MKKNRLLLVSVSTLLIGTMALNAQEVITGGSLDNEADWTTVWRTDAPDDGDTIMINYTDDVPAEGDGGCLRIAGFGQCGAYVFQEVTLIPRHVYALDAAFKNISTDDIANTWVEIILSKNMPVASADFGPGAGDYRYMMNTWFAPDTLDYDGLISDRFEFGNNLDPQAFSLPDTGSATTWYIIIKTGCWNTAGAPPAFDFLFDNITLTDLGVNTFKVDQLVDGEVTDADDFTCELSMTWDADSIYMSFEVADEVIHTSETDVWNNDNIEIYFDMDNSKNPTWPRNAGWPASSYDENDYQLRMVPGVDWSDNNSLEGARQVYEVTATGYKFTLNILWDSLLADFDAVEGTLIGFDVLASDNDGDGRNQITWNAPTAMPWNDASLFGTVELFDGGIFLVAADTESPSAPVIEATADAHSVVTVTWSASTDNIAILNYTVMIDGEEVADMFASSADGEETYVSDSLADGTYEFEIVVADNAGNETTSNSVSVDVLYIPDAIHVPASQNISVYPNPTNGIVTISSGSASLVTLEVYSITGELISSHAFTENYILDMSAVSSGIYILKLQNEGQQITNRLIVD
jgi:hypothetical protein